MLHKEEGVQELLIFQEHLASPGSLELHRANALRAVVTQASTMFVFLQQQHNFWFIEMATCKILWRMSRNIKLNIIWVNAVNVYKGSDFKILTENKNNSSGYLVGSHLILELREVIWDVHFRVLGEHKV